MASEILAFLVTAVTTLFVIIEPVGAVPMFAALTAGRPAPDVRRIALRASLVGAAVLLAFAFGGRLLLGLLEVRIDSFRMAGGLLLLLTAVDMLKARQPSCRCTPAELEGARAKEDVAVVPVAIPLLSGPGAMASVMMLMSRASSTWHGAVVALSIALIFAATYLLLRSATLVNRVLGPAAMAAVQRVLGLMLAATAIQFIVEGGLNLLRSASA